MNSRSNYDRFPLVHISDSGEGCLSGWDAICKALQPLPAVTVVEVYPGCDANDIQNALTLHLQPELIIRSDDALLPAEEIESSIYAQLGDDRVFAVMQPWTLENFFCPEKIATLRGRIHASAGPVLIIGTGASILYEGASCLLYADLSRWEIQARQRAHRSGNIGVNNASAAASELYRRSFFVDWRAADRQKQVVLHRANYLLDTHLHDEPKMLAGKTFRNALKSAAHRPFRVVPFFDPGPWGGHWMKEKFGLPDGPVNYAWCFDCVPEENSLRLGFGSCIVEIPAIDLVFAHPEELLGRDIYETFGAEFPIRFDYLDTMGGGNLSLQVHPLNEYIRKHFGMAYTQDESYYMLDAAPDATVFLGLKESANPAQVESGLRLAQQDADAPFPAEDFVNAWPAKKHDHFLIPAGTIHCSGRNGVVLEISATPYIFTFKLWDWGRTGMDGKPRPIHLDHGLANIDWSHRTAWVRENLINQTENIAEGPGWREEKTGLHSLEFIETRRHWFTVPVSHDTNGTVNVLNLVEGEQAIVESPTGAFPPFEIHYGETFIVPASVGPYTIRPAHEAIQPLATLKAFVREKSHHA